MATEEEPEAANGDNSGNADADAMQVQIEMNQETASPVSNPSDEPPQQTGDDLTNNNNEDENTNANESDTANPNKSTNTAATANTTANDTKPEGEEVELARPASTVISIEPNLVEEEEDDYQAAKEQIDNYQYQSKHVHPGPNTTTLPQPPKSASNSEIDLNSEQKSNSNLICCTIRHIAADFKGNNPILCNRLCLCGTDVCTFVSTLCIINLPSIGFYWAHFAYLPQRGIPLFVVCLILSFLFNFLTDYFLIRTNMTDPGILPRFSKERPMFGPFNQHDRYCKTCHIVRPIHAKHCRTCNNCVDGFDHHCPWTGTCIAARNIRYFIGFITFGGLYGLWAFIVCLIILIGSPGMSRLNPIAVVGIILIAGYGAIIACMLVSMSVNYIWMIGNQLTTNEKIKYGERLTTDAERKRREQEKPPQSAVYCEALCKPLPESRIRE